MTTKKKKKKKEKKIYRHNEDNDIKNQNEKLLMNGITLRLVMLLI